MPQLLTVMINGETTYLDLLTENNCVAFS